MVSSVNNILIRSKDRKFPITQNTDLFEIELPITFKGSYRLTNCLIPNTFYNVRESNNVIYFNENSTDKQAVLTPSSYSATELATEIKTQMDIVSSGFNIFTITFDTKSGKMTYNSTQSFNFQFGSFLNNSAFRVLGFKQEDSISTTSITSSNVIDLSSPPSIAIRISQVSTHNFNTATVNGSFYIPLIQLLEYIRIYHKKNFNKLLHSLL
jgi:hypothetical protein